jgi:beta-galactosidase
LILSTQYYRPPFPGPTRWRDDLRAIRETGFHAITFTVPWAWVEPEPDRFVFDDLDELVEEAERAELGVIPNVWAEIQPLWIHRELPDAHMVDHMGHRVASSQLAYMNLGLTPGACMDHPAVRERTGRFVAETARRYAGAQNLRVWDCWNEIRWLTQADGYVCYCEATVAAYRRWLEERFGSLDGLNAAWQRRYAGWEDVVPAKLPTRTYTDMIAFQGFLTARAAQDLKWRYDLIRAADSVHPIIAHTAFPAVFCTGEFFEFEQALARGNDWELADQVDGFGSSHFPAWIHTLPSQYGARLEAARCAAGEKTYWMGELQGGAAAHGMQAMEPVAARTQSRWIWTGVARGAKGVNFWCWRDEVFGRESGGFGIVGADGHRDDRLSELARVAAAFDRHGELLDGYRPEAAHVGVVFEPTAFHLDWAALLSPSLGGDVVGRYQAGHSLQGYLLGLERLQIPYDVLEKSRPMELAAYRVLVLPWPLVVAPELSGRIAAWVRAGGTLLVESEVDAFDEDGFYRYPDERPFAAELGIRSEGRRALGDGTVEFEIDGERGRLRAATWLESLAPGGALVRTSVGGGQVFVVGTFAGLGYWPERYPEFERFLRAVVAAGDGLPELRCDPSDGEVVQWRLGESHGIRLLFVTNAGEAVEATFEGGSLDGVAEAADLITGAHAEIERRGDIRVLTVQLAGGGHHVLRLDSRAERA